MVDYGSLANMQLSENVKLKLASVQDPATATIESEMKTVKNFTISSRSSQGERPDEYGQDIEWQYGNPHLGATFTLGYSNGVLAALIARAARTATNHLPDWKWEWEASLTDEATVDNVIFNGKLVDFESIKDRQSGTPVLIHCLIRITDKVLAVS